MNRDRADRDERPTIDGSRVRLAGEVADGPAGVVIRVDGPARLVHFDGERKACMVTLEQLRRLP